MSAPKAIPYGVGSGLKLWRNCDNSRNNEQLNFYLIRDDSSGTHWRKLRLIFFCFQGSMICPHRRHGGIGSSPQPSWFMQLAVCRVICCDFLLHKGNLDVLSPLLLKTRSLTELRQLIESNVKGNEAPLKFTSVIQEDWLKAQWFTEE